jgi:succinate-semialdehyde dehydrogenase/glutarate-semialdehyde dehydrogenase
MALVSIDPASGTTIATYTPDDDAAVAARLAGAAAAFAAWRTTPLDVRTAVLARAAVGLDRDIEVHARLITREMGKPLREARAEVAKCAAGCRYYAAQAARMLEPERVATDAAKSYVAFDPLGAVLAIMPWNFPFWQVFRFAAPALAAGNVAILKHASNVCGCALAIADVFRTAGAPEGVFTTLLVEAERVPALIADARVRAVTLTGSERAGASVAAAAGRALKKCVLELGGSDPFLVLADADVPQAARRAAAARVVNSGQRCIAAKRFIVVDAIAESFTPRFVDAMEALVVGDPLREETQVGPLARADLRDEVARQVEDSCAAGARLLCGGRSPSGPGFFYAPTVLAEVTPGMPAFDEEVFGPVAAVVRAPDEPAAIALANRSRFGLGANVWTRDVDRAERIAHELDAGLVFINDIVHSDPRLPFGGVKHSGFGRELSHFGLREFVNVRTIVVGADDHSDGLSARAVE